MAPDLDPKLRRIIDNATSMADCDDTGHPATYHMAGSRGALGGGSSSRTGLDSFKFLSALPQSAFELDDFDRALLLSSNLHQAPQKKGDARFSIPARGLLGAEGRSITEPRFLYARQSSPDQVRMGASQPIRSRSMFQSNKQQSQHPSMVEPTAIFYGVQRPAVQLRTQGPKTPTIPVRAVYAKSGEVVTSSSSASGLSSPSHRASQWRMNHQPRREDPQHYLQSEATTFSPLPQQVLIHQTRSTIPGKPRIEPPVVQGIQLISTHELPDRFRQVFPYELFNAVQSKCFTPAFQTGDNMVVSAPTGSGKTIIMELAICRLVQEYNSGQFKVVYQAPTKSLCAERARDWSKKFRHLNLQCAELTGDTDMSEMRAVGNAAIIVTTPEKWDSITRKWKDHIRLLQMVKLFLIDEVHILKDIRGATLEAVVSRMKSVGVSVRFLALSATVPNFQDIAVWLGKDPTNSHLPAHREIFGEEFRPVKLQKYVYGFEGNANDFAFENILDKMMPDLIMKHTKRKPIMVFCFTRKSCEITAAKLAKWWATLSVTDRPWPNPTRRVAVCNKELHDTVNFGVAFHHAGLDADDRTAVENAYLAGFLSVICCTTTLAIGVNLPCHLVIVKNTVCYTDGGLGEYSDLEIMQILGRAGRPQFDDSAIAIIMTRSDKVDRYQKMISGHELLESTLHLNLIEHLNSEISLGTVHDVYSAKRWLAGTFLSVRMRQNPNYYKFSCDTGSRDADEKLEQICERDIELLQRNKLITKTEKFACTEYGMAMSKYMVQFETMKLLLSIPKHAKMTQILHIIAQAIEFKDLRLKPNERSSYREFNKSPLTKCPIKENIMTYAHKVSLLIQVQLGGVDLPISKEFGIIRRQFLSEKMICFDRVQGLVRCVVECKAYECDAVATCNSLELARSISAQFWENSPMQLRQIPDIGPAAVRKLVQANIKSVRQLIGLDAAVIERILSRNPPFGMKVLNSTATFPRLTLRAHIMRKILKSPVKVLMKAQLGFSNAKVPYWNRRVPGVTFVASISNGTLAHIWRSPIKKLEKGLDVEITCELSGVEDTIICQLACEEIVGTVQTVIIEPDVPASAFPPPQPASSVEALAFVATRTHSVEPSIYDDKDSACKNVGSDYGGDSVFEDFVNIDTLDQIIDIENDDEERELSISEPVQMKNGKWQCNHKCRDGQLTKNGQPCKHRCCHEGLDKPRKVQKKKVTVENDLKVPRTASSGMKKPKAIQMPTKTEPGPRLKLAESGMYLGDVEELDLADEQSMTDEENAIFNGDAAIWQVGKATPMRLPRIEPVFSYASGFKPDVSIWHGSDEDFPSPAALLRTNKTSHDRSLDDLELPVQSRDKEADAMRSPMTTLQKHDSSEHTVSGSDDISEIQILSSNKRLASPLLHESHPKRLCPAVQIEEVVEAKATRPEWVNDIDPDLVAFFEGWAEFV